MSDGWVITLLVVTPIVLGALIALVSELAGRWLLKPR
jgi:hypothetical protein